MVRINPILLNAKQMLVEALQGYGSNAIQFTICCGASYAFYLTTFADQIMYSWLVVQSK